MTVRKTILITGANGGIGSTTAEYFLKTDWNVVMQCHENLDQVKNLYEKYPNQILIAQGKIQSRAFVSDLFQEIHQYFGRLDVLVNNAGIAQQKLFMDISDEEWQEMFDIHVTGAFLCCQYALKDMIAKKKGKIINVASIWGITGASCEVHYSSAKAALIGMTKALAKEVGPCQIQVNAVAPGYIQTAMNDFFDCHVEAEIIETTPLCRLGATDDVTKAIWFLASDASDFITGQVLQVNGGQLI